MNDDDLDIECFDLELPHGITLSCRAAGPADAPRIVFVHGFPEAAFVWDELMRAFADRYRCIAPNLRGFERSSAPTQVEAYRAKHLVADLVALIEETGSEPLEALVAHDWGGAVGWNLAAQRPELLRRLVIINSPHPGTFLRELQKSPAQQAASAYMNFFCRDDAAELLAENDFKRLWPSFEPNTGWLTEDVKSQYRAAWQAGLHGGLNYYRASPLRPPTASDPAAAQVQLPPATVTVRLPTRVLWGLQDRALLPGLLDGLEAFVPDLHVTRVPDSGHWIVHEQPALVQREIEAALRGGR
jgi:pimeloyl-ACP methyl ester carboxylesterase